MTEIEPTLRHRLDMFYDHIDSQPMSAGLRNFVASEAAPRKKLLQPLLASVAGLAAAGVIILVGVTAHTNSNKGSSAGPAGIATVTPSLTPTATPTVMPPPSTPNPAFPGTALTLSGANDGDVSVTSLQCSNKTQTGDIVIQGTVNGSNLLIQFLDPAIFGKPPFQSPTAGHPGQPYVSLWVWKTSESTAPNWGTYSTAGVTFAKTNIVVDVDLPALSRSTGTTHVTGTIACTDQ